MPQILVPTRDVIPTFTNEDGTKGTADNHGLVHGYKKGVNADPIRWSYVDELPEKINNTLDFVRTEPFEILEGDIARKLVTLTYKIGTKTGISVVEPPNRRGHTLSIYHSKGGAPGVFQIGAMGVFEGGFNDLGDEVDATIGGKAKKIFTPRELAGAFFDPNDPRRSPPYNIPLSNPILTDYPDFIEFKIDIPETTVGFEGFEDDDDLAITEFGTGASGITDYDNLWVFVTYILEDGLSPSATMDPRGFIAVTEINMSLPDYEFEVRELATERMVDDRSLMKSIVNNEVKKFRDEKITWDFEITEVRGTDLGLLKKVSPISLTLGRWSNLNLQIMSGSINFAKNTLKVRATNDVHKEMGYKEIIERERVRQDQEKLKEMLQAVKNRSTAAARLSPHEDASIVDSGGANSSRVTQNNVTGNGEMPHDGDPSHPVKTGVMGIVQ